MSRTSRNFVVAYILLVGLPLLCLAGVLRSGRSLTAPVSVDGTWKIDSASLTAPAHPCNAIATLLSSPILISQSGRTFEMSFGKSKDPVPGTLEDRNLKASLSLDGADASCGAGPVVFTAAVDPKSEPRLLTANLSFLGCPSCAPVEFRAVRQPKSQGGGAH